MPIINTTKLTKKKTKMATATPPLRLLRRRQSHSRRLYYSYSYSSSMAMSVSSHSSSVVTMMMTVTMMLMMKMMMLALLSSFTITGVFVSSNNLPNGFIAETVLTSSNNDVRGITGKFAPHPSGNTTKSQILIIVSKNGQVNVIENPDDSDENAAKSKLILDLALVEGNGNGICTNGERGLQSITVHPKFGLFTEEQNNYNYVYLFYTNYLENCPVEDEVTNGTWNVVNRFLMNPITLEIDYQSKEEIWRTTPLYDIIHNGGGMDFSSTSDSKLYITTGDSGKKQTASNLQTVFGKLIRLNDDGTIPNDNPYTVLNGYQNSRKCGNPTNGIIIPTENENDNENENEKGDNKDTAICSEIYGYGFRNPFRIEMDKTNSNNTTTNGKVKFSIGDVGGAFWEELSYGGTDYAGMNYGWPDWEGPCRKDSFSDCPIPPDNSDSSNKTNTNNAMVVEPFHYYQHRTKREGGAVAGQVFVPSTANWPSQYKYLFIDFIFLEIYNLIEDPTKECRTCLPPISGYKNESFYTSIQRPEDHINNARMVEMFFGPYKDTQALYVLKFGTHDSIIRIRYNGIVNNTPPVANFTFVGLLSEDYDYDSDSDQTEIFLSIGEDIQFNGSISSDVDESVGDILTYSWDFGDSSNDDIVDDGNNELGNSNNTDASMANNRTDSNSNEKMSTMSNPIHSYQKRGEYIVTLSVVDIYGQTQQKSNIVQIGIPPTATILSPNNNDVFYVSEILELHGEAYDYNGNVLDDDTQLKWEVRKHHADHFHPFMDTTTGNNLSLYPAPEPEDFSAITNSYLQIILYATDIDGLTTIVNRIVQPSLVTVNVTSNIPLLSRDHEAAANNMTIIVDDSPIVMNTNTNSSSSLIKSWRNHELNLKIDEDDNVGANNKKKNDEAYTFIGWSDGNTDTERTIRLTESVQTITAYFCGNTGQQCYEDDYTTNENELPCCNGLYCVSNKCIVDYVSSPDSSETMHDTDAYSDSTKPSSSSGNNKLNLPPGILIGLSCVIVLISILTCIICIKRKKQRKMENSSTNNNNNNNNNTAIISSITEEIIDNGLMKDGNNNDDDNYSVDNNVTMNMSDGISSSAGDDDSIPTDDDPSSSSSLSLVETTDDSNNNIEGHNNNDNACSVHVTKDSSADEEKGDTAAAASSVVD